MSQYINLHHQVFSKIKSADRILLATHEKPDVDAAASVCAMIEILENLGKPYFAYCPDIPPYQFSFIPHLEKIKSDKSLFNFKEFGLIIAFDAGSINRTGLGNEIKNRNSNQIFIEIDHHPKVEEFADYEVRNTGASATTEIIYDFFKLNKIKINKKTANCILAGILTDSGNFIFPSTSKKTVDISSEMLNHGASLSQIMESTLRNKSLGSLKIWGKAMTRMKINKKYNFGYTILTLNDIEGVSEEELEGIPNFLGNLYGVNGIMFLREQADGTIKGSFRSSHPTINLSPLARAVGGGGHAKAAGFIIDGKLEQTEKGWRVVLN